MEPAVVEQVGDKYVLGERLGGGGMAEVFAAVAIGAEGFEREVAIKRVLPAFCGDPAFAEMFANEARIASRIHHPNVVAVIDFDRDADGRLYLVMERVVGGDLRQLLNQGGAVAPRLAAYVCAETLRGLAHAHELCSEGVPLRIVHRDVSPHNILISRSGAVKVADFGIARAFALTRETRPGTLKGKLGYLSPEQVRGEDLDGRSDLFALGAVTYELLTGERLFRGRADAEVIARTLFQPIPCPRERAAAIPVRLAQFVRALLERDRCRRPPTAARALDQLLELGLVDAGAENALAAEWARRTGHESIPAAPTVEGGPRVTPASASRESAAAIDLGGGATLTRPATEMELALAPVSPPERRGRALLVAATAACAVLAVALWAGGRGSPTASPASGIDRRGNSEAAGTIPGTVTSPPAKAAPRGRPAGVEEQRRRRAPPKAVSPALDDSRVKARQRAGRQRTAQRRRGRAPDRPGREVKLGAPSQYDLPVGR